MNTDHHMARMSTPPVPTMHHILPDGTMTCGSELYPNRTSTNSWENVTCADCLRARP
jgi:hypothetical protein